MPKKFLFLLIFCLICSISIASAGNNTTTVDNPTTTILDAPTINAVESGDSNISFEDGYKGYCAEWGEHSAEENQTFYVESTDVIDNNNYLKIMFLFFYNQTQKDVYTTQHMVWKFTDNKQFSRFNQSWYDEIISLGEIYKIPDNGKIKLNDTHELVFSFRMFIAQVNEYQNYFAYKFYIKEIGNENTTEINNNTINNSTIIPLNHTNNNSNIQYNYSYDSEYEKNENTYILNRYQTGVNIWILFCAFITVFILSRKYH